MSRKHRILIIDDNTNIVDALKCFLAKNYDIITAYNGLEGYRARREWHRPRDNRPGYARIEWGRSDFCSQEKVSRNSSHCYDRLGRPSHGAGKGSKCRPAVTQDVRVRIHRRLRYRVVVLRNYDGYREGRIR